MITPAEVVEVFKSNVLLYSMFDNLDTDAGEAILLSIAEKILHCHGGNDIYQHCPRIFNCWASNLIAYILATWNISIDVNDIGNSSFSVPPVITDPILHVKRNVVGAVSREYALFEPKCKKCDDGALAQIRDAWMNAKAICDRSRSGLFLGGGSNWPEPVMTGCCGADKEKR